MPPTPARPGRGHVLPLLDRLTDDEPGRDADSRPRWRGSREDIKASVLENLSWVLNARRSIVRVPPSATHLLRSVAAYGLPDFTEANMESSDHRESLRSAIESVIKRFEPRLAQVYVSPPEVKADSRDLWFNVSAVLNIRPTPEPIQFDSVLRLPERAFDVRKPSPWTTS